MFDPMSIGTESAMDSYSSYSKSMTATALLLTLVLNTGAPVSMRPLEFKRLPKLAELAKEEAVDFMKTQGQIGFINEAKKNGVEVTFEPSSTSPYIITVESIDQRNRDRADILANATKGASLTKVEITLEQPGADGKMMKERIKGEAEAGYFGTTEMRNLSGSPEAKYFAIDLVNRDRARAVGKAVYNAVKDRLPGF